VAKPVWTNANRVNHANQFVPRSVQLNAGRPNINSVRPNINTSRTNINSVRPNINSVRQNVNFVQTNINTVRSKQPVPSNNTNSFSLVRPQGYWGTVVKTSADYNWRRTRPNFNYNSGSNFDHPLKNMKDKKDIMLVQVYVDDIIFGSIRKSWCDEFEALMKGRFQMSSMGELTFFLRLQVKQKTDGIFISQDKYVADMLKKFDLASVKTAITPMET
ncbi:retrovirus-related pol polyprotein from transposon TNT 1-94, partial [Tanacetum coccineum]